MGYGLEPHDHIYLTYRTADVHDADYPREGRCTGVWDWVGGLEGYTGTHQIPSRTPYLVIISLRILPTAK